jgi:lipopolysaccharide heptosyltransferase II
MKIVVRGTNWIGDAVMTIPALRAVRRLFPDARIALHTRSWAEGIFRDVDFLDEIITYEEVGTALKNAVTQGRVLKDRGFDLAILFTNSFESALAAKLGRIPKRFGHSREGRRILLTNPVTVPKWKNQRHEVFYYLNLVAEVEKELLQSETVMNAEPRIDIPVSGQRRLGAREILQKFGVDPSRKTVALGVGSTNSRAKRWPAENYARLNDLLQSDFNANVILIGSAAESGVSENVFNLAAEKPIIMTGKTKLDEAVAVLSEIDFIVANDMGLAHIAPAVGTRTLVIFGPTNPKTTAPFSPMAEIIREAVECSPCMLRDCPIDHRCMTRITAGEVFERVKAVLAKEQKNYPLAT